MEWDMVATHDWRRAEQPQNFVLSVRTTGCGCCSEGKTIYDREEAMIVVANYIDERENEILMLREWLARMETASEIVEMVGV